jgi:hypothetical protein
MEAIQKRQKLHEYIDLADDEKVNALFTILEADDDYPYQYSAEELKIFYERKERYLKGEGKSFSVEESFDEIRKSK